ncbi:class I adenylate-forming enzyme family protein [Shewanella nanhaiensis]|uniref:Acyl--CoA ligase n=1 Tax=Shewanella nanhaiensis TaxID=2864872 RepID=A0ABS7E1E0_9GAMM|nr:class I adenylate-forming enzyme family protein [Shewanella nanhaiensis]MBW8183521.1 acyl--CoA ligase [Shewanella nanhaiensis]
MSILNSNQLEKLLSDDNFASGNFLRKVISVSDDIDDPLIYLDEPYVSIDDTKYISISLRGLRSLSEEYASFYHEQGIVAKDVVGIYVEDGLDYMIQFLALTSLGAVAAFLNGGLSSDIAALYLEQLNVSGIFTTEKKRGEIKACFKKEASKQMPIWIKGKVTPSKGNFPVVYPFEHSELDPVLLTHTSGTTGIPKAVQSSHFPYLHGVKDRLATPVQNISRFLNSLPHAHSSSIGYIMEATIRGCPIKVQTQKSAEALAKSIETFRPDYVLSFPNLYVDMLRLNLNDYDFSSIFYWRSTGDAAHERHVRIMTQYGSHLAEDGSIQPGSIYIDGMGSTEMGSALFTTLRANDSKDFDRCVGKPADYVDAQILDEHGRIIGEDTVGFLAVKSPSVIQGYWNNTNKTEQSRVSGYWVTGDLAYKDSDGNFYHVDRITDRIETSEGMLYSLQTEELIMKKFDIIFDCSIFKVESELGGETAILKAELMDEDLSEQQTQFLLKEINEWLSLHKVPKLASLSISKKSVIHAPLGVTGKVLKRVLRDQSETQKLSA